MVRFCFSQSFSRFHQKNLKVQNQKYFNSSVLLWCLMGFVVQLTHIPVLLCRLGSFTGLHLPSCAMPRDSQNVLPPFPRGRTMVPHRRCSLTRIPGLQRRRGAVRHRNDNSYESAFPNQNILVFGFPLKIEFFCGKIQSCHLALVNNTKAN